MRRTLRLWELNTHWDELVIISKLLYKMPQRKSKTKNRYLYISKAFAYRLTLFAENEEERKTVWRFIRRNADFTGKRVPLPPIFRAETFYRQMEPTYTCLKEQVKLYALYIIIKGKNRPTHTTIKLPYSERFAKPLYKIRENENHMSTIHRLLREGRMEGFLSFALWTYYRTYPAK